MYSNFFSAKKIKTETHLVPQAYYEMARLYIDLKEYDKAEECLNKTTKFSDYLTETMISFRVKISLDQIKKSQKDKSYSIKEVNL